MTSLAWISGRDGSWFDPSNWTQGQVPQSGDQVTISSGMPAITNATIEQVPITLGGPEASSPAGLELTSATLSTSMTATGGDPAQPVSATLLSYGTNSFIGQLSVEAFAGSLTVDAERSGDAANFTFADSDGKTFVLVSQESTLHFSGEQITNAGTVQVEGALDVGTGVQLVGNGRIELSAGGRLSVEGSVGPEQSIFFLDGKDTLAIANASEFHALIGVTQYGGDRIDLAGVQAQSASYQADPGLLTLYAGPNQTGAELAQLRVLLTNSDTWSIAPLPKDQQTLTSADFSLGGDGHGGTLVTYSPQGPTYLEASLPVAPVAETGTWVSLDTILTQSFGTATPAFYSMKLLPAGLINENSSTAFTHFWGQPPDGEAVTPVWRVNGEVITQPTAVTPNDDVQLLVGNQIPFPPQIQVQVTPDATGTNAEFVNYSVWTVDPAVAQLVKNSGYTPGEPNPADIVASALSHEAIFPGVLNANNCNWIADDVAAAAGATMPLPNALLDPSMNVEGGFWRIAYRGSDSPTPVQDWSSLVQPGDIVRMEWFSTTGHTTTVLGVNSDDTITVYDNGDRNAQGQNIIGVHDASYWNGTDPAGITIYRLDPNHQYLIEGTSLGETIQGSVYNNLIRPGGGADVITAGAGNNEIQGTTEQLKGIAVTDFHIGDTFNFTDLDPAQTRVCYDERSGMLDILRDHEEVAAITLPEPLEGESFIVTPDGNGGTIIELTMPEGPVSTYVHGLLANSNVDGIGCLVSEFAGNQHGDHQHHELLV